MAFLTSGGSSVTSANIVDGEIVNADISASAAIAQSKIAGSVPNNTDLISFEQTVGTTHSLTTVAGQRVLVIATGQENHGTGNQTTNLQYNAVTKATVDMGAGTSTTYNNFCLQYTEVPGAATQNITVTSGGTLANVTITVIKLRSA